MHIFWAIVLAAILAFFGRLGGGVYLFVVGLAGAPGGLLAVSERPLVRQIGRVINILGACYALGTFVAFAVAFNRYLMDTQRFVRFPLWVEAFIVAYSPVWYGYVEIRAKQAEHEPLAPMQQAWWLMTYVVIALFLVFVFVGYYGPWVWVEAVIKHLLPVNNT